MRLGGVFQILHGRLNLSQGLQKGSDASGAGCQVDAKHSQEDGRSRGNNQLWSKFRDPGGWSNRMPEPVARWGLESVCDRTKAKRNNEKNNNEQENMMTGVAPVVGTD